MSGAAGQFARPPAKPGVRETLVAAAALMRDHPLQTMLPLAAVQAPLVLGTSIVTALLYTTVFADDVYPQRGLTGVDEGGAPLFALMVLLAIAALLGLVGLGATIVSVGALAEGRPLSLTEALDPAFSRLGGLVALLAMFMGGAMLLAVTIIGLLALPWLATRFGVAFQIYLLEETGPVEALGRSWRLMHSNMLRLLALILLGLALVLVIGLLVPASPGMGEASRGARIVIDALLQIVQGAIAIPVTVFAHAAVTLYYLRIREART